MRASAARSPRSRHNGNADPDVGLSRRHVRCGIPAFMTLFRLLAWRGVWLLTGYCLRAWLRTASA